MEGFAVRYRKNKAHVTTQFRQPESLYRFVKKYAPKRIYMMQQGIQLMKYEGSATDFRVHLHKNGRGKWEVVGIGAKVAGDGAVTTHVHNGGRVVGGDTVLREWYGSQFPEMRAKLEDVAICVATRMEGMLQGPCGEWGLDIGLDEEGRVWIFEANAKPGRAIFRHPDLREAGRIGANRVIEYAAFLAGYPLGGDTG
jgi:hypothetical protein